MKTKYPWAEKNVEVKSEEQRQAFQKDLLKMANDEIAYKNRTGYQLGAGRDLNKNPYEHDHLYDAFSYVWWLYKNAGFQLTEQVFDAYSIESCPFLDEVGYYGSNLHYIEMQTGDIVMFDTIGMDTCCGMFLENSNPYVTLCYGDNRARPNYAFGGVEKIQLFVTEPWRKRYKGHVYRLKHV